MATYAFDFIDADGTISSVDVGVYATDAEAVWQGRLALASRLTAMALDVWCNGRHLIRLTNPNPSETPRGEACEVEVGHETASSRQGRTLQTPRRCESN